MDFFGRSPLRIFRAKSCRSHSGSRSLQSQNALHCACSVTASAACRMSTATGRRRRSSRATRSATSTSTLPMCALNKASCICSLPSIAPKFAFVELHEKATTFISREFLLRLIAAVPYKIHTVLTDNGIQFTTPGAGGCAVPLIKKRSPMANVSGPTPSNTPAPPMISNTEGQSGETPELQRIMRQELRSLWADRSNRFRSRAFRTILDFI
ncbi:hypothetical protein Rleg9DRAFT_5048 [Rhizobium leguminosarum bv. trifolii WSM597]|uniref:Integrase family protein n=1 Tax=Rhizobium leguminosarum bv. trifolii WSM597 TaxID=754764 RepID=I9NDX9_RHILT|nr:hypothetical protein Rleg9DRAFT_5048 [Rhizobium leguminosarum bv. trifolii WSM597]